MPSYDTISLVIIDYTNHQGERQIRGIRPISIRFGVSEWHKQPQWLLLATDVSRNVEREFAMNDIHHWQS